MVELSRKRSKHDYLRIVLMRKKKQKIVISVKRLQDIEELAEFVTESTFPNSRTEPEQIAEQLGITHNYGHYEDAFDGLLEYCDGDFHIFGNLERVYYPEHPRARFTFSHELGHYFIDEHRNALAGSVGPHASFTDYQVIIQQSWRPTRSLLHY